VCGVVGRGRAIVIMGRIEVMFSIVADAMDCVNAAEEAVMLQSAKFLQHFHANREQT